VKEASANLEQIMTILRDRRRGFLVLSGDDAWTLPLIAAGADGVISVIGNEVPRPFSDLVRLAREGDFATARKLHERLLPLMLGNFMESNPGPVKAAMKRMGILQHDTVRPPLARMTDASYAKLDAILRECELL
jgi:4-hydroxy-tetrahydrodipicolinate synthase